jgi:hypothetical protein
VILIFNIVPLIMEFTRSDKFVNHVEALSLWLNLTSDLILKVQTMASFLHLTEMPGLYWPWRDFDFPEPNEQTDFLADNLGTAFSRLDLDDEEEEENR